MAFLFTVQLGRLICRNKESTTAPHDIFALAGAVVVDGERHPFALPSVPVNEKQLWDYGRETIYDGFSETPQIGLELVGLDIDDNEKWVKNRKEAGELADKVSEFSKKIPVVGDLLSLFIKAAPYVVDQFVKWDENDVLLNWSETVDMSAEAAVPYQKGSRWIEVRFKGTDFVDYSDWDYSLQIHVSCMFTAASSGQKVEKSLTPFINTRLSDWMGIWDGESVSCSIRPSEFALNLLDVSVTEREGAAESTYETTRVGISKVFFEAGRVEDAHLEVDRVGKGGGRGSSTVEWAGHVVVERGSGRTAVVSKLFPISAASQIPIGAASQSPVVEGKAANKGGAVVGIDALSWRREQSGSDLLELVGGAVLEIYHVLHDGKIVGEVQLRYVRPVGTILWRQGGVVDEVLQTRVL